MKWEHREWNRRSSRTRVVSDGRREGYREFGRVHFVKTRIHCLAAILVASGCTGRSIEDTASGAVEDVDPNPSPEPPAPAPTVRNATLEAVTPRQQTALAGSVVAVAPGVRILQHGRPVSGVAVRFETEDSYDGAVSVIEAQTDIDGVATAETWELGPYHATYVVVASLPGTDVEPVRFSASTTSAFELVVHGVDTLEPESREQIDRAVRRWQGAVIGPLSKVSGMLDTFAARCERDAPPSRIEHRGVHVFVHAEPLVGAAGRGGPCVLRADGSPSFGRVVLDSGIVGLYTREGALEDLMLHELGHVLGLGTLWTNAGLLRDPASAGNADADPYFAGARAREAFEAARADTGYEGPTVPVEDRAWLEGSVNSHWRESVVGSEAMSTSRVSLAVPPPLSAMTIASLADLGYYAVNMLAADPWRLPAGSLHEGEGSSASFRCAPLR